MKKALFAVMVLLLVLNGCASGTNDKWNKEIEDLKIFFVPSRDA